MNDLASDLRTEFLAYFRVIKGRLHVSPKGDRNWIQYVLERWFIVTAFAKREGITSFWHFDSDVMIVTALDPFEQILSSEGIGYTKQCSGACLNGFISTSVAEQFCRYIIAFFRDEGRLAEYQARFDRDRPTFALTEMETFWHFDEQCGYRGCHLESHFPGWWFDDVLCEDDGCDVVRMGVFGPAIKNVKFDGRHFTVGRNGQRIKLAALNCSWLPINVFDWILTRTQIAVSGRSYGHEDSLGSVWPGVIFEYRGLRSRFNGLLVILRQLLPLKLR